MSILARVFVIINFVCVILFVGVSATHWHHQRNWKESFNYIRHDYQELAAYHDTQVKALQKTNENYKDVIDAKNQNLSEYRKSLQALAADLATAVANYATTKQDMVSLLNDHSTVLGILSGKDSTIRRITQERDDFKDKFQETRRQKNTIEKQVYRYVQETASLQRKLNDLKVKYADTREDLNEKELMLATLRDKGIDVETLAIGIAPPPIDAKVVAVNAEVDLVLLSVGADDGVKPGYQFTVYNGDDFVAKVTVEKVMKDVCGCRVLFKKSPIKVNYNAATQLN